MDVSTRAMLVSLKITAWSSSKLDKAVTSEVLDQKGATDQKAGRFTKALVANKAMAEIKAISTGARQRHYELTLPWSQDGSRILPTAMFETYDGDMKQAKDKYEAAVRDFLAIYPNEVQEARSRLGDLFNENDYPDVHDIESKFVWQYVFSPLPTSDDFRVSMSQEMADQIKKQYEEHAAEQIKLANNDLWQRAYGVISHMAERLEAFGDKASDKPNGRIKTFQVSTIENVKELAQSLKGLNISQDPDLDKLADEMIEQLTQYDSDDLKTDTLIRQRVAKTAKKMADDINTKMGGF